MWHCTNCNAETELTKLSPLGYDFGYCADYMDSEFPPREGRFDKYGFPIDENGCSCAIGCCFVPGHERDGK